MKKMMRLLKISVLGVVCGAVLGVTGAPVWAQNRAQPKPEEKKVRSFDFDGDQIDGDQIRPDGDLVKGRLLANRTSLIKIRLDFRDEIMKSAEDL